MIIDRSHSPMRSKYLKKHSFLLLLLPLLLFSLSLSWWYLLHSFKRGFRRRHYGNQNDRRQSSAMKREREGEQPSDRGKLPLRASEREREEWEGENGHLLPVEPGYWCGRSSGSGVWACTDKTNQGLYAAKWASPSGYITDRWIWATQIGTGFFQIGSRYLPTTVRTVSHGSTPLLII